MEIFLPLNFLQEEGVSDRRMAVPGGHVIDEGFIDTGRFHLPTEAGDIGNIEEMRVARPANRAIAVEKTHLSHCLFFFLIYHIFEANNNPFFNPAFSSGINNEAMSLYAPP